MERIHNRLSEKNLIIDDNINEMISGRVIDVLGKYVKVRTQNGEKVLRMRGKKVPNKGWILEFRKEGNSSSFVGSVILESTVSLPPLVDVVPLLEMGISDPVDVTFLVDLTRSILLRLGKLPKWYYKKLEEYYKKGEGNSQGVCSHITVRALESMNLRIGKPDFLRAFGDWMNTFSHPYYFRSYRGKPRPARVFINKSKAMIRIDYLSKEHGRVLVEGLVGKTEAKLKVVPEKALDQAKVELLQKRLEKILGRAFVVQGGKGLGFRV